MMFSYFFQLSLQGIYRKKKSSILTFLVLLTSFSFIIVALSIVGSISKTNDEYRLNTYGEWSFAILPADGREIALENHEQVEEVGKATCYGVLQTAGGFVGIGTVDNSFCQIGRIVLEDGRLPESETEIVMEASTLSALGYDYTLNQEITVHLAQYPEESGSGQEEPLPPVVKTFTLCGVVREFSSLWCVGGRDEQQILVGAFVTPAAAEQIAKSTGFTPSLQLFLKVAEENRQNIRKRLISDIFLVPNVFENTAAYPNQAQGAIPSAAFYIWLIGAVSLAAVFSVFFLQMRDSYHSYAVCRSIGMTKKQLALLLTIETLCLAIPAVILGTFLGSVFTFLSLRLLLYSGSAPIQVAVPMGALVVVILLWVICAVVCRLILFLATTGTQLSGAFQMSHVRSVKVRRITRISIVSLSVLFTTSFLFTAMGSFGPLHTIQYWPTCPAYTVYSGSGMSDAAPKSKVSLLKDIPGISYIDGIIEAPIAISFPGMNEICAWLYCLDTRGWDETFDFGIDRDVFQNGDIVLLTFEENRPPDVLPADGTVTLHFLSSEFLNNTSLGLQYEQYRNEDFTLRFQPDDGCITEKTTPVAIREIPNSANNRLLAHIWGPYTVICSEKFLENVLSQLEPGQKWDIHMAGGEFGYSRAYVGADLNSGYLSTDVTAAKFCSENGLYLVNRRQEFLSYQQEGLQELIFLLSSGGCVSIITLLLLCNILQLETSQERKKFAILRMIGMSKKQVKSKILSRSVGICLLSTVLAALFYVCYTVLQLLFSGEGIVQFLERPDSTWNLVTLPQIILVLCVCVIAPFLCFLLAKMGVVKEGGGSE